MYAYIATILSPWPLVLSIASMAHIIFQQQLYCCLQHDWFPILPEKEKQVYHGHMWGRLELYTSQGNVKLVQYQNEEIMQKNQCYNWNKLVLKKHVMIKKVSQNMEDMIRNNYNMILNLVPPDFHWRNAVEVAIQNYKAHFLSILADIADNCSLSLWDRLLLQVKLTLNLL